MRVELLPLHTDHVSNNNEPRSSAPSCVPTGQCPCSRFYSQFSAPAVANALAAAMPPTSDAQLMHPASAHVRTVLVVTGTFAIITLFRIMVLSAHTGHGLPESNELQWDHDAVDFEVYDKCMETWCRATPPTHCSR